MEFSLAASRENRKLVGNSSSHFTVPQQVGAWRSLVARFVRDEEAVGSNPAAPTS